MIEIPLSKKGKNSGKYVAIIDECDSDLAKLDWSVRVDVYSQYAHRRNIEKNVQNLQMHRIIMERMQDGKPLEKGQEVDHINGNGLDNRRGNLRLSTRGQNQANRKLNSNSTSGYKGVTQDKKWGKWKAQICHNKKKIYIGTFGTPEEAYEAYKKKAVELHGEFARFE